MRKFFAAMATVVVLTSTPVVGQGAFDEPTTIFRLSGSFDAWLKGRELNGVMAIRRGARAIETVSVGIAADAMVELASVSKSITAVCAAELVAADQMRWDDTLSETLGRGPDLTLQDLITQSGGLRGDSTQGLMLLTLDQSTGHRSEMVLDAVAERGTLQGSRGEFWYTNENYALAALMIEATTGRDYEDVCSELALAPVGVSAQPSPRAGPFLPWGGWSMRVADYAQFHAYWFGTEQNPKRLPHADAGYGVNYGMGTFFRTTASGNSFWHFGALCFPGRMNVGSFAVTWFGDWTVVAAYDGCVSWDDMVALDSGLAAAVFGERK